MRRLLAVGIVMASVGAGPGLAASLDPQEMVTAYDPSRPVSPASVGEGGAGDTFFVIDNIADAVFQSDTGNVSGDSVLNGFGPGFWTELSPSDQLGRLFLAQADGSRIYRIRELDGQIESLIQVDQQIKSIAYDPFSGTLWGMNLAVGDNRLFTVDVETGATTLVGDTGIFNDVTALVYDPFDQQMYAAAINELYSVDPVDASARFIGDTGLFGLFGLAVNPLDGKLYGVDAATDSVFVVSRTNGGVTFVGGPFTKSALGTGISFPTPESLAVPAHSPIGLTVLLLAMLAAGGSVVRRRLPDRPDEI